MPRRPIKNTNTSWLWFILAIPIGLITALWLQRKKLPELTQPNRPLLRWPGEMLHRHPRYTEPVSIPIDTRLPLDEEPNLEAEAPVIIVPEPQAVDNLQVIEGIGPKISTLLNEHGITSFRVLSQTPIATLDEILTAARLRHLANPETWIEQARLADAGDTQGLQLLQASLKGGRHTS